MWYVRTMRVFVSMDGEEWEIYGLGGIYYFQLSTAPYKEFVPLTLKTEASNRSFPDAIDSLGLSRFKVLKSPSGDLKSGMPACTEIPAPRDGKQIQYQGEFQDVHRLKSHHRRLRSVWP